MPTVLLPLQPGTLPPGTCFSTEQERLLGFANVLHAILNGQSFINVGPDVPSVENQNYLWYRTTDGLWYRFDGEWISPRPPRDIDPNTRILFEGTAAELLVYDRGENAPGSDRSGPMWEIDTNYAGRSPIGPGNLPDSGTAIVVGTNYGGDEHTLVATELPAVIPMTVPCNDWGSGAPTPATFRMLADDQEVDPGPINISSDFTIAGGGQPHTNLSPVRGCYICKPTARLYYTIP